MKRLTVSQIQQKLIEISDEEDPFIAEIDQDERKGVKQLLKRWRKHKQQEQLLQEKFMQMTAYERKIRSEGFNCIAGIDEAGRGPLAGPVVAGAVILPKEFFLPGLDDSKKLSEKKREEYYNYIKEHAVGIGIGVIHAHEIDKINIYEATKKAMLAAIVDLKKLPDFLLIDAIELTTPIAQQSIIKGDANSVSIAAASIIAKVTRDRFMKNIDKEFPQYAFKSNMGYGTKEHLARIQKYGASPYHRKSFAPIKNNRFVD